MNCVKRKQLTKVVLQSEHIFGESSPFLIFRERSQLEQNICCQGISGWGCVVLQFFGSCKYNLGIIGYVEETTFRIIESLDHFLSKSVCF